MKLYARAGSFRAQKILVAAQYAGASVEVVVATDKTIAELEKKNAVAPRLPLLETDQGCLIEANAIMRFLANGKTALTGKDAFESAKINSWCDFASNELDVQCSAVTYPIIGWMENNPAVTAQAMKDLKDSLKVIESHLTAETYLVGRAITLADICVAAALVLPMKMALGDAERKSLACVTRWFETVVNQPEFLKVVGPVSLVKKAVKASAPAKTAAPAAKKEQKKPAAAVVDPLAAPKKAKHPLELLPKSDFVIDAWKRQYSNAPDGNYYAAMDWFWKNIDLNGFCLLQSTYNYNEECKVGFQVSNLVTGFTQRCDEVRKYAFGVMNILGQEGGPMEIHSAWVIRGSDAEAILNCNPDAEYHTWTVVKDLTDEKKKEIADMWCSCDKMRDMPVLDSVVFK